MQSLTVEMVTGQVVEVSLGTVQVIDVSVASPEIVEIEILPHPILEIDCQVRAIPAGDLAALEAIRKAVQASAEDANQSSIDAWNSAQNSEESAHTSASRAADSEISANESEDFKQECEDIALELKELLDDSNIYIPLAEAKEAARQAAASAVDSESSASESATSATSANDSLVKTTVIQGNVEVIYADIQVRHDDIIVKHGEVEADRVEVSQDLDAVKAAQADIVIRHDDIIDRQVQIDVTADKALVDISDAGDVQTDRVATEGQKQLVLVTEQAGFANADANRAEVAREGAEDAQKIAEDAIASLAGYYKDGGAVDASSGKLPPEPTSSTIWRITAGGTLDGVDYGIGDSLVFTTSNNSWFKIDNTESVYSVNGYHGVVSLTFTDVNALPDTTTVTDLGGYTIAQVDQLTEAVQINLDRYQTNNDAALSDVDSDLQGYKGTNDDALLQVRVLAESKLSDAPSDNMQYVRMNGEWVQVSVPISWSSPAAFEGQTIINPPYTFNTAEVYINGTMQEQSRGAFTVAKSQITVSQSLEAGDEVQVVMSRSSISLPDNQGWLLVTEDAEVGNTHRFLLDSSITGSFTLTLPLNPVTGFEVYLLDVGELESNPVTINRNNALIMGNPTNLTLATDHISLKLLFCGPVYGWRIIE